MPIIRTSIFILLGLMLLAMANAQVESSGIRMELLPDQAVIKAGDTLQFVAIVYNDLDTASTPDRLRWSANGGQIDNEGKYTAPQEPGVYEITVSHGRFHAKVRVEVRIFLPKIARIELTSTNPTMEIGQACQFQAIGYDRRNRPVPFVPTWSATGGSISVDGNYSATMPGKHVITAQDPSSNLFGRATVSVKAPHSRAVPLYRYVNGAVHLYTASVNEIGTTVTGAVGNSGYRCEGVSGFVYLNAQAGTMPLYRYFNGSNYLYTLSPEEIGTNVVGLTGQYGYKCEGVAGFVYSEARADTVPLYRYSNGKDFLYTVNAEEIGTNVTGMIGNAGYKCEGVACYIFPPR